MSRSVKKGLNFTHAAFACVLAVAATSVIAQQPRGPMDDAERRNLEGKLELAQAAIIKLTAEKMQSCADSSPLNSVRQQCAKRVPDVKRPVYDSENNCKMYFAGGTRELLECRISSNERGLASLRDGTPFKPFEAPDGSTKKSRKNTSTSL